MKSQTIFFENKVYIKSSSTIAGPKEGEGPLKSYFHNIIDDDLLGQKSFELAETKMHTLVVNNLLNNNKMKESDISCGIGGDLLDEIVGCNFTYRELDIPFLGVYSACASFGESLIVGSSMISGGFMQNVICSSSSHFSSAERQYRYPLELGSQRTPLSQWTVTGAGCTLLSNENCSDIVITCGTIGRVVDYGVKDANNMGGAMAPAALDTLLTHLRDTNRDETYYDLIVTGDLGHAGSRLLQELAKEKGVNLDKNYTDCGILIFNREAQKVNQGGSGACCCNLVFNSYIITQLKLKKIRKLLFIPTGALLSKTSSLQGESIPSIAHAVCVEVL